MRRVWMLGLLWMFVACSEKGPPEGAVRLTVNYGSYRPACLRVVARDARGHEVGTNLLQSEFKDPEARRVQVAVLRHPEWSRELTLEVSSFAGSTEEACSGTLVETHFTPSPILVPQRDFASFEVTLRAKDDDGDTFIAREEGVAGTDCDDGRGAVYPGAAERCSVAVDYDCDGLKGCQDSKCQQKACDDGDACTTREVCTGAGVCQGTPTPCTPSSNCFRVTGGCTALGNCTEEPDSSKVNAACAFAGGTGNGVCRVSDGKCSRFPYVPSNFDPDVIPTASILPLFTTCNVTFDSTTLSWSDGNCVSNPPTPIELPQGNGMVLFALSKLELSGELRLVGNRPVIFAVYGDATLNSYILSTGRGTVPGAGGSLDSACREGRRGRGARPVTWWEEVAEVLEGEPLVPREARGRSTPRRLGMAGARGGMSSFLSWAVVREDPEEGISRGARGAAEGARCRFRWRAPSRSTNGSPPVEAADAEGMALPLVWLEAQEEEEVEGRCCLRPTN
ncbi:putative metal-binding motif-containing protein [Cystobacter fuscus]|uniref:putative metal-binding motif-containing protein n=1 Tax=Cystobacter fuscus TaxID=43 RepID=UPI0037BFD971